MSESTTVSTLKKFSFSDKQKKIAGGVALALTGVGAILVLNRFDAKKNFTEHVDDALKIVS